MEKPEICNCEKCPLSDSEEYVPTLSDWRNSEILLVGEAPGEEEVRQGKPFVGASGRSLEKLLGSIYHEGVITNCILCHPPENRDPNAKELKACKAHLKALVKDANIIYCIGRIAFERLLPGLVFKHNVGTTLIDGDKRFHVLYHPAAAMHNPKLALALRRQYAAVAAGRSVLSVLDAKHGSPTDYVEDLCVDLEYDLSGNVLVGYNAPDGAVQFNIRRKNVN